MAEKKVQITLTFEMDERTAKLFLQSSIERVINTSIRMLDKCADNEEDQYINLEDWNEWKPVLCSMWTAMHDALFRSFSSMPASGRTWTLRKGE